MSRMHKEEYRCKRKETQVIQNNCYICGFTFSSEDAFKAHAEKCHNQEYIIQRSDSVTKSPPTKKAKEHHIEVMDMESQSIELHKDKEIADLKELVEKLQEQLQFETNNRENRETPPDITVKVNVREVLEEEDVNIN